MYSPEAVVYNRVPTTIPEYLRQRFRIHRQSLQLLRLTGKRTSTKTVGYAIPAIGRAFRRNPDRWFSLIAFTWLEITLRVLALVALLHPGNDYSVWEPIQSTKLPIRPS